MPWHCSKGKWKRKVTAREETRGRGPQSTGLPSFNRPSARACVTKGCLKTLFAHIARRRETYYGRAYCSNQDRTWCENTGGCVAFGVHRGFRLLLYVSLRIAMAPRNSISTQTEARENAICLMQKRKQKKRGRGGQRRKKKTHFCVYTKGDHRSLHDACTYRSTINPV